MELDFVDVIGLGVAICVAETPQKIFDVQCNCIRAAILVDSECVLRTTFAVVLVVSVCTPPGWW
jgi:hypothetical protein